MFSLFFLIDFILSNMVNKVFGVVTEAAPQKCEGDSGESQSQVPLVTGRDGFSYDAQK